MLSTEGGVAPSSPRRPFPSSVARFQGMVRSDEKPRATSDRLGSIAVYRLEICSWMAVLNDSHGKW